ncbi:hypothetical protein TNCV_1651811 [Trichonephila clavipes]|nr:hypothetical protein TNCV_1651811 [Trichonephila clavipes]
MYGGRPRPGESRSGRGPHLKPRPCARAQLAPVLRRPYEGDTSTMIIDKQLSEQVAGPALNCTPMSTKDVSEENGSVKYFPD